MIFVSVGTQKFPMDRLLKMLDEMAAAGEITDEIFAQSGYCTYTPEHYPVRPFLPPEEFAARMADSDLVIAHGGVSVIVAALNMHKPVIVFPRLAAYGEHVDDHQLEIAQALAEKDHVLTVTDRAELTTALRQVGSHTFAPYISGRSAVVSRIEEFIDSI